MTDENELLRRIIERVVEREIGEDGTLSPGRPLARRIADEVLDTMRREGLEAKWRTGFGPWQPLREEEC